MIMVIAFMALSIPLITGSLAFASTLGRDSVVKTEILKRQYSALGGDQWGSYLKTPGCYDLDLNGDPVNVCVEGAPGILSEPPPADNSRRLFTSITIDRTTAFPSPPAPPDPVPEIFTYTITVTDRDDEPEKVTKIHATLPPGFAYVDDSTTLAVPGPMAYSDPSIQGQDLTWNMSLLHLTLQPAAPGVPAEYIQLSFDAEAILYEGNYCTEAWADPGQVKTGTGLDAMLQVWVDDPDNNLCTGAALSLDNTVYVHPGTVVGSNPFQSTYTLSVENRGTLPLNISNTNSG